MQRDSHDAGGLRGVLHKQGRRVEAGQVRGDSGQRGGLDRHQAARTQNIDYYVVMMPSSFANIYQSISTSHRFSPVHVAF